MVAMISVQHLTCERFGVPFVASPSDLRVGIAENVLSQLQPINGLRHPPQGHTTGWYIWAGEYSTDGDFFVPLCVECLDDWCPKVLPYLGLPPGWRFLIADGYEDVWFDPSLLDVS